MAADLALIGAHGMSPEQQRVFTMFIGLGPKRTIPQLFALCQEQMPGVTLRMIKRWSAQFKWTEMAKNTQAEVAQEAFGDVRAILLDLTKKDLETIQVLKQRFYERVQIDPNDPSLTHEQRIRAIDPDLGDYANLLKQERMILADPNENNPDAPKLGSKIGFTEEDIERALGRMVIAKHGLPEVTYEQDEELG